MCVSEFNPVQQPLLNDKVLRDKRKKLRETFERIVRLYERENPETYKELRKLEHEYETKRGQLSLYFDSVKVSVWRLSYYLLVKLSILIYNVELSPRRHCVSEVCFCCVCCQNAESVEVDSIPLPEMPHAPSSVLIQDIPLPGAQPPSILKKTSSFG